MMKKVFPLFLMVIFVSCLQNKPASNKKNTLPMQTQGNKPTEFEFDEEMHNFGTLQSGEIVIYTFQFTNTGGENLYIESVDTDCGCISAHFSNEPVLPGETGAVEIEFDSSGLFGKQLKTLEIHANTKKSKQLVIFAEVENEQIEITY